MTHSLSKTHPCECEEQDSTWVRALPGLMHLGLKAGPLCPTFCIPYPTAFPYGNGMVLHFYQQQESSTTKTVHKVINEGLKAYV